jgi:hypothetical protein
MAPLLHRPVRALLPGLLLVVRSAALLGCRANEGATPPVRTGTHDLTVTYPDTTDLNATIYLVDSPDGAT